MPTSLIGSLIGRDLAKSYGARRVLQGNDITCSPGQRVGLVGENGAGKSTLIRLLVGLEQPDAGTVERPDELTHLPQTPEFPAGATIGQVLDEALAEHHEAVRRLDQLAQRMAAHPDDEGIAAQYGELLEWAQQHDAWDAERRAGVAAGQLGLDVERGRPVAELSGGQQVRLALAALIARRPQCVVLDEPTNHLDEPALAVLEDFLRSLDGVVLVASHDRTFLDNTCTHLVDLDRSPLGVDGLGGNTFTGSFSDHLAAKRESRRRWEETWQAQQDEIAQLRHDLFTTARTVAHGRGPTDNDKFIHKFKGAKVERATSRRVAAAQAKLDQAQAGQLRKPRPPLRFDPPPVATGGAGVAVQVRDLVVPGRLRLARLDVAAGEKLLVSGENGSGKSTLLAVLAGALAPGSGSVVVGGNGVDVGYLPQDVHFADPTRQVRHWFAEATATPLDQVASALGSLGLVAPRDLDREVGVLSVGQQRRLALAAMVARSPRIQLLDEPTNHISLVLADELEEALQASAATVLVATHDRWLRRRWVGRELALPPALGRAEM